MDTDDPSGPRTAEELMRSRYAAFARGDAAYLLATWHASTRPAKLELDDGVQWRGLVVIETVDGEEGDDEGVVEFRAVYREPGAGGLQRGELHERSRFVRHDDGRWLYLDGRLFED